MSEVSEVSRVDQGVPMRGLIQGKVVHYCVDEANPDADIPCFILKVQNKVRGIVDLVSVAPMDHLRRDGGEYPAFDPRSISYSETRKNRTWHWMEEA
jgi:hypothetical protein